MALTGKLTKKLVDNLGAGRHGDASGLYLVTLNQGRERALEYRQAGDTMDQHFARLCLSQNRADAC